MTAYVHVYATYAIASDGNTLVRVPLTKEQIVQLAAESTELAAQILRWESKHVQPGTREPNAPGGVV